MSSQQHDANQVMQAEAQLSDKGYSLQDAYKKIGGIGKQILSSNDIFRSVPLYIECSTDNGLHVGLFSWIVNAIC